MDKTYEKEKEKFEKTKKELKPRSIYSAPFSVQEIETALKKTTTQRVAGFNGIYPEFLKFTGVYARRWLVKFYSNILETCHIPK